MNRGITKENMLFTLPLALRGDASTEALAAATAEALTDRLTELDRLRIISNIDNLEEALLAILARDFKVDWWDPNYSLEEKRRTLKDSWRVHKLLGTKAAVETAIRAVYPKTTVEEWFQYGGEPYHFRLAVNATNGPGDAAKRRQVLSRVDFYKSLRSHCDGVKYFMTPGPVQISAGGAALGSLRRETVPPVTLAAEPPRGEARAQCGGGIAGVSGRMEARAALPPLLPHGAEGKTWSGGAVLGQRRNMTALVPFAEAEPPKADVQAGVRTGVAGVYQKITREVFTYGALD